MRVAELRADPLMANKMRGKIMGKTRSAFWRSVRTTARRATARVCSMNRGALGALSPPGGLSAMSAATSPPLSPVLLGRDLETRAVTRALELTAGLGQEHVVERRLMELERLHLQI